MEFKVKVTGTEGLMEIIRETTDNEFAVKIKPDTAQVNI